MGSGYQTIGGGEGRKGVVTTAAVLLTALLFLAGYSSSRSSSGPTLQS
eukprot:CAMPEP_0197568966 /NCGR_PEP_ID=MMETSP1320-20131121/38205_1 /TAXON_ID=91990 /ORGANISM="Bolidomonas sp., Strain RCC2347" /LENGTH=47 /DNA_ID= /DNA_START= /DNA_END= /DNA_ORIENTATION=